MCSFLVLSPPPDSVYRACAAVYQAERDSERFAVYARKAALDERAEEIKQQLKVRPTNPKPGLV